MTRMLLVFAFFSSSLAVHATGCIYLSKQSRDYIPFQGKEFPNISLRARKRLKQVSLKKLKSAQNALGLKMKKNKLLASSLEFKRCKFFGEDSQVILKETETLQAKVEHGCRRKEDSIYIVGFMPKGQGSDRFSIKCEAQANSSSSQEDLLNQAIENFNRVWMTQEMVMI